MGPKLVVPLSLPSLVLESGRRSRRASQQQSAPGEHGYQSVASMDISTCLKSAHSLGRKLNGTLLASLVTFGPCLLAL